MDAKNVTVAVLGSSPSKYQEALEIFLKGMVVRVTVDGVVHDGVVTNLDLAPPSDHAFAVVYIPDLDSEFDHNLATIRVALNADGSVNVMPGQPQDA